MRFRFGTLSNPAVKRLSAIRFPRTLGSMPNGSAESRSLQPVSDAAAAMLSQIKSIIRTMYSNPPLHGGKIVETVLGDADRRANWESELAVIRNRIRDLRATFVATMQELAPNHDFQYINQQRGMFSYSGLKPEQVKRLREEHSIYILGSGRINVAGINNDNLQRLCQAIASVL